MLAGLAEGQKNSVSMKELDIGEYCIASDACNSQQRKVGELTRLQAILPYMN